MYVVGGGAPSSSGNKPKKKSGGGGGGGGGYSPTPTTYSPPVSSNSSGNYSSNYSGTSSYPSSSQGSVNRSGSHSKPDKDFWFRGRRGKKVKKFETKKGRNKYRNKHTWKYEGKTYWDKDARNKDRRQDRKKKKKANRPPSLKKYLGSDATYQNTSSDLQRILQEFSIQNKDNRGDVKQTFNKAMSQMKKQRRNQLKDIEADFASRGLLNSGLYGKARGKYNEEYQSRVKDLTSDRGNKLEDLLTALGQQKSLTRGKKQDARLNAIRRRAQKYGIKG